MTTQTEALKLALEALEGWHKTHPRREGKWDVRAITAIKEALSQPELTFDGLTPTEFALRELYEFQEATGCDTAAEFKAQPEQEPMACIGYWNQKTGAYYKPDQISAAHQKLLEDGILRRCYTTPPQRKEPEQEPVAWMKEGWGPDCGPYIEFYRDDEMGWRDRKEWTPLYTTPPQQKKD